MFVVSPVERVVLFARRVIVTESNSGPSLLNSLNPLLSVALTVHIIQQNCSQMSLTRGNVGSHVGDTGTGHSGIGRHSWIVQQPLLVATF